MKVHKKISKDDIRPLPHLSANSLGWESCPCPFNAPRTPPTPNYYSSPPISPSSTTPPTPTIPQRSAHRRPPPLSLSSSNYFPREYDDVSLVHGQSLDIESLAPSPISTIFEHEEAQYPLVQQFKCNMENNEIPNAVNCVPGSPDSDSDEKQFALQPPDPLISAYAPQTQIKYPRPSTFDFRNQSDRVDDMNVSFCPESPPTRTCRLAVSHDRLDYLYSSTTHSSDSRNECRKAFPKLRSSQSLSRLDKFKKAIGASSCTPRTSPPQSQSSPQSNLSFGTQPSSGAWKIKRKPVSSPESPMSFSKTDSRSSFTSSMLPLYKVSSYRSVSTTATAPTSSFGSDNLPQSPARPLLALNLEKARGKHGRMSDPGLRQRDTQKKPRNALTRCIDKVVDKFAAAATSKSVETERKELLESQKGPRL